MYSDGKLDYVRNKDGIWINVSPFREAGNHYIKYGYYCADPFGSLAWSDYWNDERRKCIYGVEIGGARITGDHYFYLNYCPIQKVEDTRGRKSQKITGFPDFWDGDYNYFWVREIARKGIIDALCTQEEAFEYHDLPKDEKEKLMKKLYDSLGLEVKIDIKDLEGGWNLIVGKSRRKGYSYKNASVAVNNYYTKPSSLTILNAYEKKFLYPRGIMTMTTSYINFINANTGWSFPSDVINRTDHIKASFIEYKNGIQIEKGFMSEIMALTCKDNPDTNRGKDALDIIIDEAGAFGTPGLLKSVYAASEDCVMAGSIKTGLMTIFGTSGDMEGGTADYADMFSRPEAFGLMPFVNIWDENALSSRVGFFHPVNWNMEGFYDENGNSDKEAAKKLELETRENLKKSGATSSELQKRQQEKPLGPGEAFSAVSVNNFPVAELKAQLLKVKNNGWQELRGTPVQLIYDMDKVKAIPILDKSVEPITSYHNIPNNKRGCPVIYEYPVDNPPKGLYKIGYDPIDQENGTSLAAIIVYKGVHKGSHRHSIIVAEYIGRYEDPDDMDRIAEMLAVLYNTQIMHENMVTGVKNYFRRIKRLDLLAVQPDAVISKNVKNSKVARIYGCHMNIQLKDAGERYTKSWLLDILDYDEYGNPVRTIDTINSIRLLEELISYNRKGNFDLVSALFMCMFQVQEEEIGKEYDQNNHNKKTKKIAAMVDNMYARASRIF